jgi:hypothetical protein
MLGYIIAIAAAHAVQAPSVKRLAVPASIDIGRVARPLPRLTEPMRMNRNARYRVSGSYIPASDNFLPNAKVPALAVSPNGCGLTGAPVCPGRRRVLFRASMED